MKICIVGAGAIGGYLGAKLALAGQEVTLIARGAHLAAIQRDGLRLREGDAEVVSRPALATADLNEPGGQDYVIVAVKAHQLPAIAPTMRALYGPHTAVVTAQNGIPWWYFFKHGGEFEGHRVEAVDPGGVVAANLEVDRVIGCVVYPATELDGPGIVRHVEGNRFTLGELDGAKTDRIQALAAAFQQAGLRAPVRPRLRPEIWVKLWGNLAFNPISALTRATLGQIGRFPATHALARAMMLEAKAVAERLGVDFGISIDQRLKGAEEVGEHKTSMLQDIEAGKPTEIDALVGAVAELGRLTDIPTPHIDAVYACVKLLETRGA